MLGTLFAGKQDIDITTDDKIVSASTDAMQYGASAEFSRKLAIARYLNLEPSLGLRYTMTDIDSLSDNVGKRVNFDVLHFAEVELGAKLEDLFCRDGCTNRLYAKPSVIQTFVKGGKTQITGVQNEVKSIKSQTLGRLEIGGEFGLSSSLSGYAAGGYTFGEDYSAYDVNLGLNYAF